MSSSSGINKGVVLITFMEHSCRLESRTVVELLSSFCFCLVEIYMVKCSVKVFDQMLSVIFYFAFHPLIAVTLK